MSSPFRRHKQRVQAIRAGAAPSTQSTAPAEPDTSTPEGKEYAALRVLLHDNLRALKDIASHEARIPKKREFAGAFEAWIKGALEAGDQGKAAQDEILVTNMLWAIDYRDFDYALALAEHAIRFHLVLPGFNRTIACVVAEEIAERALAQAETVPHEALLRTLELVHGADMPDPALAKLYKALGRSFARKADDFDPAADNAPAGGKAAYIEAALNTLSRALVLDRNIGVKKDLERLARQKKTLAEQAATATT
ncbi:MULTISPECIES: phage terminase small subunit [unclassified Sphingomonas]|uniref:phage terminase small subunit n=1 Tax=Novosphingobium rhizosphaerae TaxID=1551649 RepID=UPI0015CD952C